MLMTAIGQPLIPADLPLREPKAGELLIKVSACGVCRTDLHVVDGELPNLKLPLVPGHEVIGSIEAFGGSEERFKVGDRVGVPWLGSTCDVCA